MIQLSNRVLEMEESATLAMSRKSRELRAQGKDIISLSLGEPDFHTPDFIKEAAAEAMEQNFTTYTPVPGYDDLRDAIANKFNRDNGIPYKRENIVVSTGAKQSIANLVMAAINPGDEVIIPAPYWVSYAEIVKVAGGVPVVVQTTIESDFKFTPEQFRKAITPKSKMMMFSSPCNPTGTVYTKEELRALADVVKENPNIIVMSDEIYEHINFVGHNHSMAQFEDVRDQIVTVNGVSKAWAMTGWRVGYIGAPKEIADACNKIQGQFTSGTCSIAQRATIAAVNADPAVLKDMVKAFENRRALVLDALNKMPGVKSNKPGGAFYVFPDISSFFGKKHGDATIRSAEDLCMYLLDKGVALVSGEAFGDANCMRISYAASEETLTEAMKRVANALAELN
ncbi:pyridoxal phosphate-dependent aminotransferase [Fluviicola sp.]|uniref:pyridoxal phosphate-dependent aminotransferase n=1 Tax=Fluviicola sp. TaxID=1917219 RepID=UPI0026355D9F|nr:pyridoxal phosphate-dependent aminotransferase [Fluviicola sp.]